MCLSVDPALARYCKFLPVLTQDLFGWCRHLAKNNEGGASFFPIFFLSFCRYSFTRLLHVKGSTRLAGLAGQPSSRLSVLYVSGAGKTVAQSQVVMCISSRTHDCRISTAREVRAPKAAKRTAYHTYHAF